MADLTNIGIYTAILTGEGGKTPTDQTVEWSIINHVDEFGDPDLEGTGEAIEGEVELTPGGMEFAVQAVEAGYIKIVCSSSDGNAVAEKIVQIVVVDIGDIILVDSIDIGGPDILGIPAEPEEDEGE